MWNPTPPNQNRVDLTLIFHVSHLNLLITFASNIMDNFCIYGSAAVQRFIVCKMSQPNFVVLCLTGIIFIKILQI